MNNHDPHASHGGTRLARPELPLYTPVTNASQKIGRLHDASLVFRLHLQIAMRRLTLKSSTVQQKSQNVSPDDSPEEVVRYDRMLVATESF